MQYSLYLVIAAVRTLMSGSVAGNAWLIYPRDEEIAPRPPGETGLDPALTFPCTGVHYADGSMAGDVTLNWLIDGITALAQPRRHPIPLDAEQLRFAEQVWRRIADLTSLEEVEQALAGMRTESGTAFADVRLPDLPGVPRDIDGRPASAIQALAGGFIRPVLADITGPAVDDGVIFPAQYGSPDPLTEGWYWSATVDTRHVGTHEVRLSLDIYRPTVRGNLLDFIPERYVLPTWLDVRAVPAVNGFTGGPLGYLPLPWPGEAAATVTGEVPADA
ncbi:MAG: hypothetical protein ACKOTZ_02920 [Chloroflexota bacterium]